MPPMIEGGSRLAYHLRKIRSARGTAQPVTPLSHFQNDIVHPELHALRRFIKEPSSDGFGIKKRSSGTWNDKKGHVYTAAWGKHGEKPDIRQEPLPADGEETRDAENGTGGREPGFTVYPVSQPPALRASSLDRPREAGRPFRPVPEAAEPVRRLVRPSPQEGRIMPPFRTSAPRPVLYAALALALTLAAPLSAPAAVTFTMEEAVNQALRVNPGVESARHSLDAAESGRKAARAGFGPSIGLNYGATLYDKDRPARNAKKEYSYGVTVSQPLLPDSIAECLSEGGTSGGRKGAGAGELQACPCGAGTGALS